MFCDNRHLNNALRFPFRDLWFWIISLLSLLLFTVPVTCNDFPSPPSHPWREIHEFTLSWNHCHAYRHRNWHVQKSLKISFRSTLVSSVIRNVCPWVDSPSILKGCKIKSISLSFTVETEHAWGCDASFGGCQGDPCHLVITSSPKNVYDV